MLRVLICVAVLGFAGCASGSGAGSRIDRASETDAAGAYIFAEIAVDDFDLYFPEYARPLGAVLPKFEGTVVAATQKGEVREGEKLGNWTVLVRFPSMERARQFYDSDEYAPLRKRRIDDLTSGSLLVLIPATSPVG